MGLELGVDVLLPVELVDQVIEIVVVLLGHVLDQQLPGNAPAFDHRLVHAEDVRAPLGLEGHQRAGGVEHVGGNQPAGARLEPVGLGEVENAVVPWFHRSRQRLRSSFFVPGSSPKKV